MLTQFALELQQCTKNQKKIVMGHLEKTKKINMFYVGHIIDVLFWRWFPLDVKLTKVTNQIIQQPLFDEE
jgi:hypothetical protein